MYTFRDSKLMAKLLRKALAERGVDLTHSECLELVARQFNFTSWNMLAAKIDTGAESNLVVPSGWTIASHTQLSNYRLGMDPHQRHTALIESREGREAAIDLVNGETAVLMQSVGAELYRKRRLRFSARLKTDAADLATIWMRVDRAPGQVLRFDNLLDKPQSGALVGTQDWTLRSVVLDVPEDAASLHFGFFLRGLGRCWATDFALEEVGGDVETTSNHGTHRSRPTNLDLRDSPEA